MFGSDVGIYATDSTVRFCSGVGISATGGAFMFDSGVGVSTMGGVVRFGLDVDDSDVRVLGGEAARCSPEISSNPTLRPNAITSYSRFCTNCSGSDVVDSSDVADSLVALFEMTPLFPSRLTGVTSSTIHFHVAIAAMENGN
ncbi:hypothetical protein PR003_g27458 [Phytophthora rubi]|uniref:Uncharacterized protein n=1 Tax=Phytophthora rubi TaxID=129364 RepID=A0A6A4BZD0_9STRA|nr:hypothetical protein PR003_g27458 [Phytophthora rubi]